MINTQEAMSLSQDQRKTEVQKLISIETKKCVPGYLIQKAIDKKRSKLARNYAYPKVKKPDTKIVIYLTYFCITKKAQTHIGSKIIK